MKLVLSSQPHLFSLVRQADLYRPYAVLAADSRQARLFWIQEGRLEKQRSLVWEAGAHHPVGRMGFVCSKISCATSRGIPGTNEEAVRIW